jgi:hypothetical protein
MITLHLSSNVCTMPPSGSAGSISSPPLAHSFRLTCSRAYLLICKFPAALELICWSIRVHLGTWFVSYRLLMRTAYNVLVHCIIRSLRGSISGRVSEIQCFACQAVTVSDCLLPNGLFLDQEGVVVYAQWTRADRGDLWRAYIVHLTIWSRVSCRF